MRSHVAGPPLSIALLTCAAAAQSTIRAPRYELPADHSFQEVADLDGDGTLDAVVRGPAAWYTLLDIGGAAIAGPDIPSISGQTSSELGDVTGDGAPDLLARYNELPSAGTSGVLLFVGGGDGTFAAPVPLAGPGLAWDLTLADIDGDGTQDVVTFDTQTIFGVGNEHTVNAWILDGATPVAAPPQLMPTYMGEFCAVDRDGDGDDEVAFARSPYEPFGDDLFMVQWDAAANPTLIGTLEVTADAGSANSLSAGDIDGDGDRDLLFTIFDGAGDDAHVLENVGGSFVVGPFQDDIGGNPYIASPHMVDWDGDGDDDLAYLDVNSQFDSAYVYIARSVGLTVEPGLYWTWPGGSGAWDLAGVADVDGDGHLDVIAGPAIMHGRGVFEQIGVPMQTEGCCISVLADVEDIDGDGDLDLLSSGGQFVLTNDGTGVGPSTNSFQIDLPGEQLLDQVYGRGDFDGDGFGDLLVEWGFLDQGFPFAQFEFLGTRLLRGQADGVFVDGGVALAGTAIVPQYSGLGHGADFDGDGDLDAVAYNGWHPNDGTGQFGAKVAGFVGEARAIADLDEDGDPDLLIRETFGNTSSWHFHANDGTGNFTEVQAFEVLLSMGDEPLLFDYDRDGRTDLCFAVIGNSLSAGLHVALNLGGGSYTAPQFVQPAADGYERVSAGDVNGDGFEDLLAMRDTQGALGTRLDLYLGTAVGGAYELESYFGPNSYQLADIDGDGDDDLLSHLAIEATTFDEPSSGYVKQYGFGFAGGPAPPILGGKGPFNPSTTSAELSISHGIGGSLYFVYWGLNEVALLDFPLPGAGVFISPITLIYSGVLGGTPGAPGEGAVAIDKTPWTTAIPGFVIPHQAVLVHGGYPNGYALTNAVTLGYGF